MRDLNKYAKECFDNLNAIDIYPNIVKEFSINTRAKHRWGQAKKNVNGYSININAVLLNEDVPELSLYETLYHELLHCVDGCMNHGDKWNRLAQVVNDCYNVNITRTSSASEKLGDYKQEYDDELNRKEKCYKVICTSCKHEIMRYGNRSPKWYAHPEFYRCKLCGGSLEKVVDND